MQVKIKGKVNAIHEVRTTERGTAVQQIDFEQENGRVIFPSLLGKKIELLEDVLPGDEIELEYHITGKISQAGKPYNNVIIDNLVRL